MAEWQPIETAPNDGRAILVSGGAYGAIRITQADGDWWRHDDAPRKALPTHWMPLPEPPEQI